MATSAGSRGGMEPPRPDPVAPRPTSVLGPGARAAAVIGGAALCVALVVIPPQSPVGVLLPLVVEVAAVAVFLVAASRRRSRVWWLLAASVALLVAGDLLYAWSDNVLDEVPFPGWADVLYLGSYVPQVLAIVLLTRARHPRRRIAQVLDSAIMSVPVVVLTMVYVVSPTVQGEGLTFDALVAVAYPLADLVILVALIRLLVGGGRVNRSLALLTSSVAVTLVADLVYSGLAAQGQVDQQPGWVQSLFTGGVLLLTAAVVVPDAAQIAVRDGSGRWRLMSPTRTVLLGIASVSLPAMIVLLGLAGVDTHAVVLAAGALLVNGLIVWRAVTLMDVIRGQRDELDQLARTDALTGLPNRRSWDFQLQREQESLDAGGDEPWVAMVDLDHFKTFNDTFGHQRGDELLRECATAWRSALPKDGYLARYGGEEFAVLLPLMPADEVRAVLERLRAATPGRLTASVGFAPSRGGERLTAALAAADLALYAAKQAGRDRVMSTGQREPGAVPPPS